MSDIQTMTTEQLAEDAFLKQERLSALMTMNTPVDFDARKKSFIELAKAREAAFLARAALDSRTNPALSK